MGSVGGGFGLYVLKHFKLLLQILFGRVFYVKQLELALTTRCSLRCRDCMNLMQYYEMPADVPLKKNKWAIDSFLRCVDAVCDFFVLGGEPFLYAGLKE